MNRDRRALRDPLQQVDVAHHLIRLRGDRKAQPFALGHLFEDRARRAEFALRRLVRIGRRADRDMLAPDLFGREVARRQRPGIFLDVDFRFEIAAVELHVLVRVAGVAVLAAEFAAAIRVHGPPERYPFRVAFVQDRFDGEDKVLRPALGFGAEGGCGEARNADQFRRVLLTPGRYRRGRGSTVRRLTSAGASGCGEKGETGLFGPPGTTPKRRRSCSKYGISGHRSRRTNRTIFAFSSPCQELFFAFISPVRANRAPAGNPSLRRCPVPAPRHYTEKGSKGPSRWNRSVFCSWTTTSRASRR